MGLPASVGSVCETSLDFIASIIVPTSSDLSYFLNTTLNTFANILNLAHFYVFIVLHSSSDLPASTFASDSLSSS